MERVRRLIAGVSPAPAIPIAAVTLVAAVVPLMIWGYPDSGDANVHLAWHQAFAAQFWTGDLFPQWLESIIWGLGAPIFYFYPPLAYYPGTFLQPLDGAGGVHAMGWAAALGLVISAASAFFWLRRHAGREAAILGGLLYAVMPYHLGVDLFERSAYGEFWSFVWLPLILAFIDRQDGGWRSFGGLSITYAMLILTHVPTALLMTLLGAAYAVCRLGFTRRLAGALGALALGGFLAAFHWLPAMAHLDWTHAGLLWGDMGYYFELDRLMDAVAALEARRLDSYLFHHLALLAPVAILILAPAGSGTVRFWRYAGALMVVMMTPLAAVLWDYVPLMNKVQFAWRLHALLCLAGAFLAAAALRRAPRPMLMAAALILALDMMAMGAFARFGTDSLLYRVQRFDGAMEFMPATAPLGRTRATLMDSLKGPWPRVVAGAEVSARVEQWAPGEIRLNVDAPAGGQVTVGQLYFPLWRAEIDGQPLPLEASPDSGRVQVHVPAGEGVVHLYLTRTLWMQAGQILSVLALAILSGMALSSADQTAFERRRQRAH